MPDLPTPTAVPAGHVVRVRLGGHCYQSRVMPAAEARTQADELDKTRTRLAPSSASIPFETADGRTVRIVARSISAIESGPPAPLREKPAFTVVNNNHAAGETGQAVPA